MNADGGEPAYAADQLRRIITGLLAPGVSHRLGARQGVRPGSPVVELSGSTIQVFAHQGVVYPGLTSSAGAYVYELLADSHSLQAADGSNPRIDIVTVQIEDDDEDSSGELRVFSDYIVGTPGSSPSAPATPSGAMRLASILVPAGGSPSPTLTYDAPSFTALGGVLPVRDGDELPTAGMYEGLTAYRQDLDQMVTWDGAAWIVMGMGRCFASSRRNGGQSIASSTPTPVEMNLMQHDSHGFYDSGDPELLTVPEGLDGLYLIQALVSFSNTSTANDRGATLESSQGRLSAQFLEANQTGNTRIETSRVWPLNAGDWVRVDAFQRSGGSLNVEGSSTNPTYLSLSRLSG